jgi:uncharacterized protein YciI
MDGDKHFLLYIDYTDDMPARRGPLVAAHLEHSVDAEKRGELVLGGRLIVDGAPRSLCLIRAKSREAVERHIKADPYYEHGLVKSFQVQEWQTVIGELALEPMAPAR